MSKLALYPSGCKNCKPRFKDENGEFYLLSTSKACLLREKDGKFISIKNFVFPLNIKEEILI
ncbi:hypothetical protein HNP86_001070 [Methanococcus maripaludis]|uniref:Uncharacterized protein n=1 Tax=Methanococcus maripaludis TaxID=39152 RepID=A0A7J9NSR0_METMI|nr:hypothetical protein [Methanococcus maripaludis]MBA2846501.1 hypothetical protein [Methanococcus maripaludis]MBA2850939.1 hypothetical protein [Methanococcus maripaludis]